MENLKIVLIGDAKVGKTTLVNMLMGKPFSNNYRPTLVVDVFPVIRGNTCFNIWDCAGDDNYGALSDGHWVGAQGAIVMCDPTNINSIKNVDFWARKFKMMMGEDIPIVYVINKSDNIPVNFNDPRFIKISCKNNDNLDRVLMLDEIF